MKLLLVLGLVAVVSCKSFEELVVDSLQKDQSNGQHWAVLVAGSKTWGNYRHQADICHSYQILRKNGIPESNIIVFMYDDIAHNPSNPTPGKIINHPNGPDVYHGVPKDYTGRHATPQNFLNVLTGSRMVDANGQVIGSGKTLNSGPNDHVFINFADHGGPGIVCFPAGGYLHASDWNNAIKKMHQEQRYGEMVMYVEACESGSMFENILPSNINVFVTTAANAHESSWACYYDNRLRTCLGDVYSVKWMEDSDKGKSSESLEQQYRTVKSQTTKSHVMQYGSMGISKEHVSAFQGTASRMSNNVNYEPAELDAIRASDVPIEILKRQLVEANSNAAEGAITNELKQLLKERRHIGHVFKSIVRDVVKGSAQEYTDMLGSRDTLKDHDCYKNVVDHFNDNCMMVHENEHSLRYMYVLVNLCEKGYHLDQIKAAMNKVCA